MRPKIRGRPSSGYTMGRRDSWGRGKGEVGGRLPQYASRDDHPDESAPVEQHPPMQVGL